MVAGWSGMERWCLEWCAHMIALAPDGCIVDAHGGDLLPVCWRKVQWRPASPCSD